MIYESGLFADTAFMKHAVQQPVVSTTSSNNRRRNFLLKSLVVTTIIGAYVSYPTQILSLVNDLKELYVNRILPETTQTKTKNTDNDDSNTPPKIAWLLSFPNSGKTNVRVILRQLAGVAMGSNYGEMDLALNENGPFRLRNSLPLPEKYILVESHCSGFCGNCPTLYQSNWNKFYESCSLGYGTSDKNGKEISTGVSYDYRSVDKIVHLIKDPLENIVDRFLSEHKSRRVEDSWTYETTPEGFAAWCKAYDRKGNQFETKFREPNLAFLLSKVPCYGAFYQYILWHDNVGEMLRANGQEISSMTMHFNKVIKGDNETVSELLDFLELPEATDSAASYSQTDYSKYYTQRDRIAISSFLKVLSTQQTWKELKQYLPSPLMQHMFSPLGTDLSPTHHGKWPSVAWLLAYPNSGTGYVMTLTQKLSGFVTATNNAREMGHTHEDIPNFAMTDDGPFRYNSRPFPKKYILTKNHCSGHCVSCSPETRIKGFSAFFRGCSEVFKYNDDGTFVQGYYHPKVVQKLVHLIRNPFDNVVANFHYEHKYHKDRGDESFTFTNDKTGFRNWCKKIDDGSGYFRKTYYRGAMNSLSMRIPCHTVFYQYTIWLNYALSLKQGMKLPHVTVYYEDFHSNMDDNVKKLFDFLELPKLGSKEPFHLHTYPDYFTKQERHYVTSFIGLSATPDTLSSLQRYFPATEANVH